MKQNLDPTHLPLCQMPIGLNGRVCELLGEGTFKQRVRELTGRNRLGVKDAREIVKSLNPVLRGWGNYFRTGNAAQKFIQLDTHVWNRLHAFMVKRKGRNLRAGEVRLWDRDLFHRLGLHRLRGTVKYPEVA